MPLYLGARHLARLRGAPRLTIDRLSLVLDDREGTPTLNGQALGE